MFSKLDPDPVAQLSLPPPYNKREIRSLAAVARSITCFPADMSRNLHQPFTCLQLVTADHIFRHKVLMQYFPRQMIHAEYVDRLVVLLPVLNGSIQRGPVAFQIKDADVDRLCRILRKMSLNRIIHLQTRT